MIPVESPREATYPVQGGEAFGMTLFYFLVVHPGIASVPIHYKGDVLRDWPCSQYREESI